MIIAILITLVYLIICIISNNSKNKAKGKIKEKLKLSLKKDKKFLDEYNNIISGYVTSYKEHKTSLITKIISRIILGTIIILFFKFIFIFIFEFNNRSNLIILFPLLLVIAHIYIFSFAIYAIFKNNREHKLNKDNGNICEYHLIERLGKILIPNFKEISKENITVQQVRNILYESKICDFYNNAFILEDCFTFNLYDNCVNIYNLDFEYIINNSKEDYKAKQNFFYGALAEITLNCSIDYFIKLQNSNSNKKEKNEILLDSSNFEKYFDVFTDNRLETTKFFDSDFMNSIIDLYNKYGIMFEFSALNNKIYILLDEKILNSANPLRKPKLDETYMKYCKIKYFIDIYTLIYNKLEKLSK